MISGLKENDKRKIYQLFDYVLLVLYFVHPIIHLLLFLSIRNQHFIKLYIIKRNKGTKKSYGEKKELKNRKVSAQPIKFWA